MPHARVWACRTMDRPTRFLPPPLRQIRGDHFALGAAAQSRKSAQLRPRTATADRVVPSICPYCAVGCGQRAYVTTEKVIQIEGDPDSPISRGRLCPKGAASEKLVNSPMRETRVKYRAPGARFFSGRKHRACQRQRSYRRNI